MTQPLVVAVMLTRDRPAMARRAIEAFRAQTYERKRLLVWNTGHRGPVHDAISSDPSAQIWEPCIIGPVAGRTIGWQRNEAAKYVCSLSACYDGIKMPDVIAHWDDDDYSHPRRIEEQVALLQASGKECVGFRELLFWDTRQQGDMPGGYLHNEAWLYCNNDARYVVGTSMCYWRRAWEACPFDDAPHEDQRWWMKNAEKCVSVSSLVAPRLEDNDMPRMVCSIHGGNTEQIDPAKLSAKHSPPSKHWKRVPEWDAYCAEWMKL